MIYSFTKTRGKSGCSKIRVESKQDIVTRFLMILVLPIKSQYLLFITLRGQTQL